MNKCGQVFTSSMQSKTTSKTSVTFLWITNITHNTILLVVQKVVALTQVLSQSSFTISFHPISSSSVSHSPPT